MKRLLGRLRYLLCREWFIFKVCLQMDIEDLRHRMSKGKRR